MISCTCLDHVQRGLSELPHVPHTRTKLFDRVRVGWISRAPLQVDRVRGSARPSVDRENEPKSRPESVLPQLRLGSLPTLPVRSIIDNEAHSPHPMGRRLPGQTVTTSGCPKAWGPALTRPRRLCETLHFRPGPVDFTWRTKSGCPVTSRTIRARVAWAAYCCGVIVTVIPICWIVDASPSHGRRNLKAISAVPFRRGRKTKPRELPLPGGPWIRSESSNVPALIKSPRASADHRKPVDGWTGSMTTSRSLAVMLHTCPSTGFLITTSPMATPVPCRLDRRKGFLSTVHSTRRMVQKSLAKPRESRYAYGIVPYP